MHDRKLLLGLGMTLWMVACSRTPVPTPRDAAPEAQAVADVSAREDLVAGSDAATLAPDAAAPDVLVRDGAASDRADTAAPDVLVRDAAAPDRADAAAPDVLVRDGAAPDGADATGTDLPAPDATIADLATVDSPADLRDSAGPDVVGLADTGEVAADPFAGRTFRIDDMHPAPTPDPTCSPNAIAAAATLTLSADLTTLTGVASSGSAAFRFTATVGPEASRVTYHVTNLTGGEVFFERDQGVWVAQVVLYGSGVPVIWCLRGTLIPQP